MKLPDINERITTARGLELCRHFSLAYPVSCITADPDGFNAWEFDGCSGLPDELLGLFTGCRWTDITYACCLPHDLCYAYGEPGNRAERKRVDDQFFDDLVNKAGMAPWLAHAFLAAVRTGGAEIFGLPFSWGFARKTEDG